MSVKRQLALLHRCVCFLGAMILGCSAGQLCAQGGPLRCVNGSTQGQQFVSTNSLLTPRKAQLATDRAREDILHGDLKSAQKELTRALDVAPHYAVALATQGAVSLQAGNIDGAAKAFQRAIEEDSTLGAAYLGVGIALIAQRRFKEAITPLNHATSLLPSSWYAHLEFGLARLGTGDTEAALQEASLAEHFAGPDPERRSGASYLRAIICEVMKDPDRANKYLAETITRAPDGFYATLAKARGVERFQSVTDGK